MRCLLAAPEMVEERYAAGVLAKPTLRIYECIQENEGIDVKTLRMLTGMQHTSDKRTIDRSLNDLQSTANSVIRYLQRLNKQGNKAVGIARVIWWLTLDGAAFITPVLYTTKKLKQCCTTN